MHQHTYHLVFRPEPEGGYTVIVPSLPGCLTWASTIEEGKQLIQQAIELYIESIESHHEAVPDDSNSLVGSITMSHA